MEEHLAIGQRADVLAVALLVGDVHEGGMDLAAFVILQRLRELAEARGERYLLQVAQRLAPKEQHGMLMPGTLDLSPARVVQWLGEIHALHFGAECRRELAQLHKL